MVGCNCALNALLVPLVCESVTEFFDRLWQMEEATPSMKISLNVESSYTSTTLLDTTYKSSAYCIGFVPGSCIFHTILESILEMDWSFNNFFRK